MCKVVRVYGSHNKYWYRCDGCQKEATGFRDKEGAAYYALIHRQACIDVYPLLQRRIDGDNALAFEAQQLQGQIDKLKATGT